MFAGAKKEGGVNGSEKMFVCETVTVELKRVLKSGVERMSVVRYGLSGLAR